MTSCAWRTGTGAVEELSQNRSRGKPIHLIGVEFSREQRSVVGFEVETLAG
jgi:hypothetical protein